WYHLLEANSEWEVLTKNSATQSDTVIVVKGVPEKIERLKQKTMESGLILGNGYGKFKNETFRIANFPAINTIEMEKLQSFFS
ncbi:MAG: alanine--glyoxylate aminotransferase family protein, partial [Bacteroidota bacterium]